MVPEGEKAKSLLLYRCMEANGNVPAIGHSWKTLGVRPGVGPKTDIPVDGYGRVRGGTGGLSVTPENPLRLLEKTPWLLPTDLGGKGRYPLWSISEDELGPDLRFRPDPYDPDRHGFIEPARNMPFTKYQARIEALCTRWKRVIP